MGFSLRFRGFRDRKEGAAGRKPAGKRGELRIFPGFLELLPRRFVQFVKNRPEGKLPLFLRGNCAIINRYPWENFSPGMGRIFPPAKKIRPPKSHDGKGGETMSLEAINQIRGVEGSADQARADARTKAQKILADAEREGRALLEQGKAQSAAAAAEVMKRAQTEEIGRAHV